MKLLTTAPAGSPEWLATRATKIGGTSAAAIICGDDPTLRTFSTPLREWMRLTGRLPEEDIAAGDDELAAILRWGTESEPLHRKLLEQETGGTTEPPPGVVQHPTLDWFAVSPDGFITIEGRRHVLETKAPTRWTESEWEDGDVPLPYQVQAAAGMCVLGLEAAVVSALIPPRPRWRVIERDAGFEQFMLDKLGHFWTQHVQKDIPPPVTAREIDKRMLIRLHPRDNGKSILLPADAEQLVEALIEARAAKKAAEEREKLLVNQVAQALGDNSEGICGTCKVTYKWQSRAEHVVRASEFRVMRASRV